MRRIQSHKQRNLRSASLLPQLTELFQETKTCPEAGVEDAYEGVDANGELMSVTLARGKEESSLWKYQPAAYRFYTDLNCQVVVAALIGLNFLMSILQAQIGINQNTRREMKIFGACESFFFYVFWCELLLNMYSSWFWKFWKSSWNVFDFVVVMVCTVDEINIELGPLRMLRMLRAFRVFRLFKRVKSLNKIIVSLGKAVPGVSNAFFIMFLVMCIYAILGYEFFSGFPCGPNSTISDTGGPYSCNDIDPLSFELGVDQPPSKMCAKDDAPGYGMVKACRAQYTFGHEYFGNFFKSLYTLFQVLTGDSWSEAIGRPLLELSPITALYFISFVLIVGIVLVNVVVAVLLEKMVEEEPERSAAEDDDPADSDNMYLDPDYAREKHDQIEQQSSRVWEVQQQKLIAVLEHLNSQFKHQQDEHRREMADMKRDLAQLTKVLEHKGLPVGVCVSDTFDGGHTQPVPR